MAKELKKVKQPDLSKSTLKRESFDNIMKEGSEELKEALTKGYNPKTFAGGGTEDEWRVNKNDWVNAKYKNPNTAGKHVESGRGTEESIYDHVDKSFNMSNKLDHLTEGRLYHGEVVGFDNTKNRRNTMISIFGGDIEWMMYYRGNIDLKVGDTKPFIYKGLSDDWDRYIFELPKKGRTKKLAEKTKFEEETEEEEEEEETEEVEVVEEVVV